MKPLLTICYYSYNDSQYWYPNVIEALKVKDNRFQIVVQDNASTDNSDELAASIIDTRFQFRKNETNVGPLSNAVKALQDNCSEYSMIAMSRDRFNPKELKRFLDLLEKNKPAFGYLNIWKCYNDGNIIKLQKGKEALLESYLSLHPTSYFWREDLIEREIKLDRFKNRPNQFDFPFELINGGAAVDNDMSIINITLFTPIKYLKKSSERKSYYSKKDYYFMPSKRFQQLITYWNHINSLNIDYKTKNIVLKKVANMTVFFVVKLYYEIFRNGSLHYGIEPQNVKISHLINNLKNEIKIIDEYKNNDNPYINYYLIKHSVLIYSLRHFIAIGFNKIKNSLNK